MLPRLLFVLLSIHSFTKMHFKNKENIYGNAKRNEIRFVYSYYYIF